MFQEASRPFSYIRRSYYPTVRIAACSPVRTSLGLFVWVCVTNSVLLSVFSIYCFAFLSFSLFVFVLFCPVPVYSYVCRTVCSLSRYFSSYGRVQNLHAAERCDNLRSRHRKIFSVFILDFDRVKGFKFNFRYILEYLLELIWLFDLFHSWYTSPCQIAYVAFEST